MFPSLGIITNGIVIIPFVAAAPYCMVFVILLLKEKILLSSSVLQPHTSAVLG